VETSVWFLLPISCNAVRHWQLLVLCFHAVGKKLEGSCRNYNDIECLPEAINSYSRSEVSDEF
jgi:hypothetical protein